MMTEPQSGQVQHDRRKTDAPVRASRRLLIMAAGTGGHIFPGLAIAREMQQRGWQVTWLGTTHGMENDLVPPTAIALDRIAFSGLRGKGLAHSAKGVLALLKSFFSCRSVLARRRPDLIVGMGGYVTVPGGVAAKLAGIPLVLVNADAALLMSNKMLLPLARKILFGFDGAGRPLQKTVVTGNPVRAEISTLPTPAQRFSNRNGALQLLVVGGSLGAQVLNRTLPAALALMGPEDRPFVTHQSGKQHIASLQAAYNEAGVDAELVAFIDDMPRRYAEADLVICRAGAISVSELCAAGVASVLVPFVASTTSHQIDNAEYMASEGAAMYLRQQSLTPVALAGLLKDMTRARCLTMAEQAYRIGRRDANTVIADELEQLAEDRT